MATISIRPAKLNYKVVRGDDFSDVVTIKEGFPAAAVDVSARTYTAQIRRTKNGDIVAAFVIDMSGAASGEVIFSLEDAVTADLDGAYFWDFQQDISGVIRTLMGGHFVVDEDVTRAE